VTDAARYREGVAHSGQILEAAGYDLIPLREPIGQCWDLLGVGARGLVLVAVILGKAWPTMIGAQSLGVPPRWPAYTVRLVHKYTTEISTTEISWPEVRVL
jgi:hypothetical protein